MQDADERILGCERKSFCTVDQKSTLVSLSQMLLSLQSGIQGVEDDQRILSAAGSLVDGYGNLFFLGSVFPLDQDREIVERQAAGVFQHVQDTAGDGDDTVKTAVKPVKI